MAINVGNKVLVKRLSLSFSDYKNLDGEVISIDGEFARVSIPKKKLSVEDLRDLRKVGDKAFITVKLTELV